MKVFVTGATGFVGVAVVEELLAQGHEVLGLARSAASAARLRAMGAEPLAGDLEAHAVLRSGAAVADAVIHTGFIHDFARFAQSCAIDRAAILALGEGASGKPFVVTSGLAALDAAGRRAVETDRALPPSERYPRASEWAAETLSARGISTSVMRLPPSVHGPGDHGFVPMLIEMARRSGVSGYGGQGANVWPAVHVRDAARAYRLTVERGPASVTCHAVAEEGVPFREIAKAIAEGLGLPCVSLSPGEARRHFGWFEGFAALDQSASSAATRARLGWQPDGPGLLSDIAHAGYFRAQD
ncbi:SDR family oxidoreductase [Aquabacter sp. L1I39]|uniref:SDR family oxidoreductase n=1 Tax=Aquabacter sp. L1I39 TaxID=2820278 RepID=UPI001ADBD622|nr:SDR family oxidoreductase [Aquabacter sp. L1I39]QTL03412.1 SDR family oxidoreductase [Aquabacter sp. L1I39]